MNKELTIVRLSHEHWMKARAVARYGDQSAADIIRGALKLFLATKGWRSKVAAEKDRLLENVLCERIATLKGTPKPRDTRHVLSIWLTPLQMRVIRDLRGGDGQNRGAGIREAIFSAALNEFFSSEQVAPQITQNSDSEQDESAAPTLRDIEAEVDATQEQVGALMAGF